MKKALLIPLIASFCLYSLFSQSSEELLPKEITEITTSYEIENEISSISENNSTPNAKTPAVEANEDEEEENPIYEEIIPFTDLLEAEEGLKELEKEIEKESSIAKENELLLNEINDNNKESLETKDSNLLITNIENESKAECEEKNIEEEIKKIPLSIASDEILNRSDVDKFRKQYMSPKWSSLLYSYLENSMEYRLYVRQQVQERELPEVLEYLPVVESNYKPSAKSRSGAVGMWQFMSNSVANFLTLNDFVDERLDPWYSTDAGLSKLTENYNYYKDWFLAIASYNCGLGAMNKALKKSPVKDYWYLVDHNLLPKQTAEYVPKLLAIADLAINSEYYGIDLPSHDEEFEVLENEKNGHFDYITVNKAYSLSALAKELRISESIIKRLNPSYIHGITHPAKPSKIRLPLGMEQSASKAITLLTPIDYPFKYTVKSGDSLWSISRKYHTTVDAICELNNIKENDILRIGKILYIPSK